MSRGKIQSHENTIPEHKKVGDWYNENTEWDDVLYSDGWKLSYEQDGRKYWTRPGKEDGVSASTGRDEKDRLFVFTSSVPELTQGRGYTKFAYKALMHHEGAFGEAVASIRASTGQLGGKNEQLRETDAPDLLSNIGKWEEMQPKYLWEPYVESGRMTLIDGDGGVGKSTVCLWLSALFSQGLTPDGEVIEPCNVMYLGNEDPVEAWKIIYAANGGDMDRLFPLHKVFPLNDSNMYQLDQLVQKYEIKVMVFDALMYFLTGIVGDSNSAMQVRGGLAGLAELAERHGVAVLNMRHTRKTMPGADSKPSDMGMGSVQFRNTHRGQLLLRNAAGKVLVTQEKGNILTKKGQPFLLTRNSEVEHRLEYDCSPMAVGAALATV